MAYGQKHREVSFARRCDGEEGYVREPVGLIRRSLASISCQNSAGQINKIWR
jgi:hypothetical protein